jgi:hypothetical protein
MGRIAPDTMHIAFEKTRENLRDAGIFAFALDGFEDF